MQPEKKQRLVSAITEAKTTLSDLTTRRDTATAELANLRAGRGELVERRNAAAKLAASASESKTGLARRQIKGLSTAAELADDLAAANSDADAAETELSSTRTMLDITDDEIDQLTAAIAEATAAIPAAEQALWAAVERVEVADLVEQLHGPLARLQALLQKSRANYSQQDLIAVVTRALDTAGVKRDQATAAIEAAYLG